MTEGGREGRRKEGRNEGREGVREEKGEKAVKWREETMYLLSSIHPSSCFFLQTLSYGGERRGKKERKIGEQGRIEGVI